MTKRARPGQYPKKRHHTERYRGPNLKVQRWTNAKAAFCGFHLGSGKTSIATAEELGDGTSPETIRNLVKIWRLPVHRLPGRRSLLILISAAHSKKLKEQSEKLGITEEEMAKRLVEEAVQHVLYNAITDGRFKDSL